MDRSLKLPTMRSGLQRPSLPWLTWIACLACLVAVPRLLAAQAICSAPHSSPTLAGGGTIGTLPAGTGWVMASVLRQSSTDLFSNLGDRQPFLASGRFSTTSLYLSGGAGVAPGLDVWAQAPVHRMHYTDQGGTRDRTGIGDLRVALRASPALVGLQFPVAVRAGLKVPGSTFPVDATIIPLTEGQRDVEVSVETGHAFKIAPLYVMAWAGYRWRDENRAASRRPGDERFSHLAVGGTIGGTRLELAADHLYGEPPRQLGFIVNSPRRILQVAPTVSRRVGVGTLDATAVVPVVGRNLPTGAAFSVGYRLQWGQRARAQSPPSVVPMPPAPSY